MLSGQLWHKECKERNDNLPEVVPLSFPSADAYLNTFEPLLFEEARESLLGDWAEACEGPRARVWAAQIGRYECFTVHPEDCSLHTAHTFCLIPTLAS